ncbi:MAG TPA: efflux RND transporter periplasmic adaptor subunit [Candidatus Acidoferrales bacterium]|nr:efflux RND transporter periplasmic adaptor subunit [Candidatus Acidoferrales bacterium]
MQHSKHAPPILLLAASLFGLAACKQQQAKPAAMGMPVVPVSAARASQESVPTELRVVGTVEASAIVQVKSQIAGELLRVGFIEGQNVAKDQVLFEVDPRPYEEALRQADANVTRDRAQIGQMEATLARDAAQAKFNATDAARYSELLKAGVVSKSQTDQAITSADVARESARATQAALDSAKAALESDVAAVGAAKLNLSYCQIRSPLAGRTGNLLVHPGNLVKANDVPLVVIHRVSPIFVNFNVPEQHLAAVRRLSASRKLAVRAFSQDSPDLAASGALSVIDNAVDTATGTIHLKATFENGDGLLWPGQFVTAVLTLDTIEGATLVPAEAVQAGQQGQYVYVIKPDNTVESRVVKVGRAFGKKVVIEKGVAPGENVVTDGHLRLFPGAQVQLVDSTKAEAGKS